MSTDIDTLIAAEVERSFGGEPMLRDPRAYAARGRRAHRRRRASAAAAGVAAVVITAVVGIGASRLTTEAHRGVEPADASGHPVRASTTLPLEPLQQQDCPPKRLGGCGKVGWLHANAAGQLVRGYADVEVTGRYDDVYSDSYGGSSALEVHRRGQTSWVLATWSRGDAEVGIEFSCPDPTRTFDQWVEESAARGMGWRDYTCADEEQR